MGRTSDTKHRPDGMTYDPSLRLDGGRGEHDAGARLQGLRCRGILRKLIHIPFRTPGFVSPIGNFSHTVETYHLVVFHRMVILCN